MKTPPTIALLTIISALTATDALADPQWTWEAGKQTNNGAITVKSISGGTMYSGTQNPTGAVAKTNQSAVTQPPTVIIQATGGGAFFNYGDNCYVFYPPTAKGYAPENEVRVGMGKLDGSNNFTGMITANMGTGLLTILGQMSGVSASGGATGYAANAYWCGSSAACVWQYAIAAGQLINVVAASSIPVRNPQKCYP